MDLWIRSQDRMELLKIDRLDVNGNQIEANFKSHYGGCEYLVIGRYETNERTLEVLDEIQNHILNLGETVLNYGKEYKEYGRVYQMPKE